MKFVNEVTPHTQPQAKPAPSMNHKYEWSEDQWGYKIVKKRSRISAQEYAAPHAYLDGLASKNTESKRITSSHGNHIAAYNANKFLVRILDKTREFMYPFLDEVEWHLMNQADIFSRLSWVNWFYQVIVIAISIIVVLLGIDTGGNSWKEKQQVFFEKFTQSRQLRWIQSVSRCKYEIQYKKSGENVVAEALSRRRDDYDGRDDANGSIVNHRESALVGNNKLIQGEKKQLFKCEKIINKESDDLSEELNSVRRQGQKKGIQRKATIRKLISTYPIADALSAAVGKFGNSWGVAQQSAFSELKQALQSTPVLTLPDPSLPFVMNCDARYPVYEQELLAIVTALLVWKHHLEETGIPVRIRTDHKSLIHFQTQPMLSGRQRRWLEILANYDYVIEYILGEQNLVADALSRRIDHNEWISAIRTATSICRSKENIRVK